LAPDVQLTYAMQEYPMSAKERITILYILKKHIRLDIKMADGASALNFALIVSGILLRLTPERAPRTILRYERPENLGFYACLVTTNVGSFNFVIEKLFSSVPLKVNSIQNGRLITTTIQTSTIDMKNTTKYCFILYIMMSGDVHYNPGPIRYPCTKCKKNL
jgi:hypothetical protein